jgi:hypothetical protein
MKRSIVPWIDYNKYFNDLISYQASERRLTNIVNAIRFLLWTDNKRILCFDE